MKPHELAEELQIELSNLAIVAESVESLLSRLEGRRPNQDEKAAFANYLVSFYSGVENTLKRISHFYRVPLPKGETWHAELFAHFCEPSAPLPLLFSGSLREDLVGIRKFRHFAVHGYAFQIDWDLMRGGVLALGITFRGFREAVERFLETLTPD